MSKYYAIHVQTYDGGYYEHKQYYRTRWNARRKAKALAKNPHIKEVRVYEISKPGLMC